MKGSGSWREGVLDTMFVMQVCPIRSDKALGNELLDKLD